MSAVWVEASKPPTVPGTNAHAASLTPVILLILHVSLFNFLVVCTVFGAILFMSMKGRTALWLVRRRKAILRGHLISARPVYFRRRMQKAYSHSDCDMSIFRKVG